MLELVYHCAKFGEARTLHAAGQTKDVDIFVC